MILVENLTKRFAGVTAVDDLSFTVAPGHVTGFLGPNGSGKSTTMRCMIGLDHAQSGSATFNGVPYSKLSQSLRRVGTLLDAGNAHSGRSARNHLLWMAANTGIGKSRVDAVLEQVGLSDASDRRKVIGLKPGKCVVNLVTRKSERFSPLDSTNKGDFYSAAVVINFTK